MEINLVRIYLPSFSSAACGSIRISNWIVNWWLFIFSASVNVGVCANKRKHFGETNRETLQMAMEQHDWHSFFRHMVLSFPPHHIRAHIGPVHSFIYHPWSTVLLAFLLILPLRFILQDGACHGSFCSRHSLGPIIIWASSSQYPAACHTSQCAMKLSRVYSRWAYSWSSAPGTVFCSNKYYVAR